MREQNIGGFEIIREIGRGGMGVVYEARQTSPRRNVALKVLPPELAHVPQVATRFADEANRMAMLEGHPNIVTVYAAGDDRGVPYFAMQLLSGADLEQHLRREGRLHLDQAAEIVAQVAEALDFTHQRGVVHRDVKPANIMFDSQGRPLVTDFGIAKARDEFHLTQTGMTIGTPEYASPEQIKGNPLDGRSDLYSLGVVLYQAVCGQVPFTATTPMAYAVKHVSEPPLPPSSAVGDIPPLLEQIIMRCLAKEPHARFGSGRELATALRCLRLPHLKCGAAPVPGPTYATSRVLMPQPVSASPSRMSGAVIALLVIGALALVVGIAMLGTIQGASPPSRVQADAGTVAMHQGTSPPSPLPSLHTPSEDTLPAATSVETEPTVLCAEATDVPGSACKVEGEEGKPIQKTDSGLQYIVLDEGTGTKPAQGDEIVAEYTGWLTDGTKFDSSADHPGEFSFPVGTGCVIPGWDEALMDMQQGERRKLIVPAHLAYGPEGMGPIPANATLVFEVKLVRVAE